MLTPDLIPALADGAGRMNSRMFVNGVRFFAFPGVRRQLEAEIRAQFAAFARTGLALDHVNVHSISICIQPCWTCCCESAASTELRR